jgi:2-polyprenyl-3-methyl-5-hydroxy-6-metoxy-1,4-benzoquinol methylase
MLAAEIVGPNGRVVGIDMDPSFLEHARRRAEENGCAPWVTFEQAKVDAFTTSDRFDALVGRYILLYLPDPAATLARLLQSVKPAASSYVTRSTSRILTPAIRLVPFGTRATSW